MGAGYITPYFAELLGGRYLVRPAEGDEAGTWTLVCGTEHFPVDTPADLLAAAPPGTAVTADFGSFRLTLWSAEDGRPRYRAGVRARDGAEITGAVETDDERACWSLLAILGDERAPRACFFCRWSDVEPSTGWGHLGCAIEHAEAYHRVATEAEPRKRKWGTQGLLAWVDEWHACERFEVRPHDYGYRGRPRR